MPIQNLQAFTAGYAAIVEKSWSDPSFLVKLKTDPRKVLEADGLSTPDGSIVNIVMRQKDPTAKLSDQIVAWEAGEKTKVYDVIIPIKPNSEALLVEAEAGDPCCCCPCSCC